MPSTQFLWVNKSARSTHLTRCGATEAAEIQHFVQVGRPRARKGKIPSAFKVQNLAVQKGFNRASVSAKRKHTSNVSLKGASCAVELVKQQAGDQQQRDPRLPVSYPLASSVDPFQVSIIPLDHDVRTLLHYYTTIYHPTLWPNEANALCRGGYVFESSVKNVVENSLRDDLMMYCLLAASACRMQYVDRLPIARIQGKQNGYMVKALEQMQRRVHKKLALTVTDMLYILTSMVFLCSAEGYRGNTKACRMHLNGCIGLLTYHNMTASDLHDTNLQGQLCMTDLFLSCAELKQCLFDSDTYNPGPIDVLELTPIELHPCPSEVKDTAVSLLSHARITPELKELILLVKETYLVKRRLNTAAMTADRALETTHWITKRNMTIRNRLLLVFPHPDHVSEALSPRESIDSLLEKAIRIALIQFTLLSMNITGRIKTVKVMSRHLQKFLGTLLQQRALLGNVNDGLPLWLAVTGYCCAEDGSETEQWFATVCRGLIDSGTNVKQSRRPTESHEDSDSAMLSVLEGTQEQYFYHSAVQRPRLKTFIGGMLKRFP